MKIAYLNNNYQLGGAETVMQQLHQGMLAAGHQSKILVTEGKGYPWGKGVRPLFPRFLSWLDQSRFRHVVHRYVPRSRWTDRAVRRLANSSYDLIHVHNFHGLYASIDTFAHLVRSKPVVWTFHRFWGVTGGCDHPFGCCRYHSGCGDCPQVGNFVVGPVDHTSEEWSQKIRLFRDLPLTVVAPSRHLAEVVLGSPIGERWKTVVIPNGIDYKYFRLDRKRDTRFRRSLGLDVDKTTLLFTNRSFTDPIKGWPVILEALRGVSPEGLQLMLAGEGSAWAAAQLPPGWAIVDFGYVSDRKKMANIYEAADLFLYASSGENFPCAIIEAMSSGCCVVSTPVDGVLEQVEPGCTGLIADDMGGRALARCLTAALQKPALLTQMGLAARARASNMFSEKVMIDAHEVLYERVMAKK
jgi:glycosyltransferase involved in cell wall biosynthesis